MVKYVAIVVAVAALAFSGCNKQGCLEKEGFKSCDDLKAALVKAQGNDEAYRFHSIAKKCGCDEVMKEFEKK
jgi:hypothetical protein